MKKVAIVYGRLQNDLQKRAIEELTSVLLDYVGEYPICVSYEQAADVIGERRCVYVGTKESHPYLLRNSVHKLSAAESYTIRVKDDTVIIEGYDDAGVLYGVLDFYNKYIVKYEHPTDAVLFWKNFFEEETLPEFEYSSAPSIKERGLWTWGHVIFDYRGYLYNMMRLKMNRVIIWNDFVPRNADEIVAYAHSCNIQVIWGFSWLWDTHAVTIARSFENLEGESERILEKYEWEYAGAGGDGIYFQTFTEFKTETLNGVLIADAASKFVNQTAALFYEKYPDLEIQFGLHATSVKQKLDYIKNVDPRIRIVWEDCGDFPFHYIHDCNEDFEETRSFIRKAALLRGKDDSFGVVTKGLMKLDWTRFKHLEGSQCLGVSSGDFRKTRFENKRRSWKYLQAGWLAYGDKAQDMINEMYRLKNGALSVVALVEDGVFEDEILYPVALYSEMLWDCDAQLDTLIKEVSMREYVTFA